MVVAPVFWVHACPLAGCTPLSLGRRVRENARSLRPISSVHRIEKSCLEEPEKRKQIVEGSEIGDRCEHDSLGDRVNGQR